MTKEEVYDERIFPLMAKIIEICKEHKIPLIASFRVPNEDDDDLHCSTALLPDDFEPSELQIKAYRCICGQRNPDTTIITTRDASGKIIASEVISVV